MDSVRNTNELPDRAPAAAPGGLKGIIVVRIVVAVLLVVFLGSGVRVIQPGEVGVVLRFGRLWTGAGRVHAPGLLVALPYPIDEVIRVPVMATRQLMIDDYWQPEASSRTVNSFHPLEQGYCLTGDYNVALPRLTVKYQISDAVAYALAIVDPEAMLKDAVGTALIQTVGEMAVDNILTEGKAELAQNVLMRSQSRLDSIGAGLRLLSVEITELIPPRSVLPDFQAVQSAVIEKETAIRNAETYHAEQIPAAQAEADQMLAQADAYEVTVLAQANADANAFVKLLEEYRINPEVVRDRLRNEYLARALIKVGSRYVVPGPPVTGRLLIPPAASP
jgi:membrane protease subunit HflK